MAALLLSSFGILKALGICAVSLVASIPIAMQVVCTSTMALGSCALGEQQAIVSRLASIGELNEMDMLCCDKTGTLTQHIMTIESKLPWGCDIGATAVVDCSVGSGVDAEYERCHPHNVFQVQAPSLGGF